MTMAYIVVVNPQILAPAGMPPEGVVFATCISAAVATLVMGLYANYPVALAPGMSLNAYFTYSVCIGMHIPWRTALGVVFLSGVLFVLLTITRVREQIVDGIPDCLKHSTAAGIGLFIAFVGMRNAKLVVANPATFVSIGNFSDPAVQAACFGIVLTLVLMARRINGAILLGILGTTLFGIVRGIASWPSGLVAMPQPSSTLLQLDFRSAMHLGLLEIIFAFLFVDLFDNVGTLVGVCEQAGFIKNGKIPRVGRVLLADGVGTMFFFSSRRRHTTFDCDWSSDVSSSDLTGKVMPLPAFKIAQFFTLSTAVGNGTTRGFLSDTWTGRPLATKPYETPILWHRGMWRA